MDINAIAAAVTGIGHALSIAKRVAASEGVVENAELKLQLALLVEALADAKLSLVEASDTIAEQRRDIERLEETLRISGEIEKRGDAYFRLDHKGVAHGDPFCTRCWEIEHRLVHLTGKSMALTTRVCPQCKHAVDDRRIVKPRSTT